MSFIADYGLFLAKSVTIIIALIAVCGWILSMLGHARAHHDDTLEIKNINERLKSQAEALYYALLTKRQLKKYKKDQKAEHKRQEKEEKLGKAPEESRLFVLDFDGDVRASEVASLRDEISAIIQVARTSDRVLLRLESPGGMVHGYGLAASQLKRLRDHGLSLTVAVDKVAASGGYMMACVADKIVAAPFAIIGSIGVVAQVPNFNKVLKAHNVDYEMHTAGDYKRTLTVFGENTDQARQKFQQELEETHQLFKGFVSEFRPDLDVDKIATGEHWYGKQAIDLGLIDEVATSDDLLLKAVKQRQSVYTVHFKTPPSLVDRLTSRAAARISHLASQAFDKTLDKLSRKNRPFI